MSKGIPLYQAGLGVCGYERGNSPLSRGVRGVFAVKTISVSADLNLNFLTKKIPLNIFSFQRFLSVSN